MELNKSVIPMTSLRMNINAKRKSSEKDSSVRIRRIFERHPHTGRDLDDCSRCCYHPKKAKTVTYVASWSSNKLGKLQMNQQKTGIKFSLGNFAIPSVVHGLERGRDRHLERLAVGQHAVPGLPGHFLVDLINEAEEKAHKTDNGYEEECLEDCFVVTTYVKSLDANKNIRRHEKGSKQKSAMNVLSLA